MNNLVRIRASRVRWYARRLAAMSSAEIHHRLVEQAKRRRLKRRKPRFDSIDAPLPVLPGARERLRALPESDLPLSSWETYFRQTVQGKYSALGRDWPPLSDSRARWHLDPVTGRFWPMNAYCFDIDYRDAKEIGDVKYVWELNRLQHLQPIAAYAARSGDKDAQVFCRREIASWIDSNPPYLGINWSSGIELALRVVSLVVVTSLLGPAAFYVHERRRILACLAAHGYWLAQFPSRFSSANNHLVAEAGGLYVLGALAPGLPGAGAWRRYGRETLKAEISKQIATDGVGLEQSPTYTAFSLEWWMLASAVGDAVGQPFQRSYRERICSAGTFLRWILDQNDNHPRIGDDDEGKVLFSAEHGDAYVPAVLQAAAAICSVGEIAPNGSYPNLWRVFHPEPPAPGPSPVGIRTFRDGGYSVVREPSAQGELLLVFDHGPLGYLSIAAHGHADALAFWLHLGGRPVLVDAGTYLYHSGGAWRDYFRGTAAHNTMLVEGRDSSTIAGPFNWSRKAQARLLDTVHKEGEGVWQLTAEHDGYRSPLGVQHRRTIEKAAEGVFEVTDLLVGARRAYDVEVSFLLHQCLTATALTDTTLVIQDHARPLMTMTSGGPLRGVVERGKLSPPRGWCSGGFGILKEASRIAFRGELEPRQKSVIKFFLSIQ